MAKNCFLLAVLLLLFSICPSTSAHSGTAGFTDSPSPRSCYGIDPENYMVAVVGGHLYQNGAGCGTKYQISCTGPKKGACLPSAKPVTVTVAGYCKKCPTLFLLPKEVHSAIAYPDASVVKVSYQL
ncbi:EG45-like domain containing protein 2 [Linum grandiflorum]